MLRDSELGNGNVLQLPDWANKRHFTPMISSLVLTTVPNQRWILALLSSASSEAWLWGWAAGESLKNTWYSPSWNMFCIICWQRTKVMCGPQISKTKIRFQFSMEIMTLPLHQIKIPNSWITKIGNHFVLTLANVAWIWKVKVCLSWVLMVKVHS